MSEFCFNVKQSTIERNISEFAARAAKYGVEYAVRPLEFGDARVIISGSCTSKLALMAGILTKEDNE